MSTVIDIKNLCKSYKSFTLQDVSFKVERGYIMGFIGPNGAGKSTTTKCIMNLINRDRGEVKIFGLDNLKHQQEIKQRIGFVYDENIYYEELTIAEMTRVIAPFYQQWDYQVFNQYLDFFKLNKKQIIKELSRGMRMKYALTMALSHHADLIIMDEPTSGLDPVSRHDILDILRQVILDEEKTILFSTHITTDLDQIADYITFLNDGQIVFSDSKENITEHYGLLKGPKRLLEHSQLKSDCVGYRESAYGFEALVENPMRLSRMFSESVVFEQPTLEDIMLYTVRSERNVKSMH